MKNSIDSTNVWNIRTNIGPITFKILIDSAFFNNTSEQYIEMHKHATFEFHFITRGSGIIFADNIQYEAVPDSYYLVKAGVYHMQKGSISNPIYKCDFKFEFDIDNNTYNDYSEEEVKNFLYLLSNIRLYYSKNLNQIMCIISEIQSELINGTMGYYTKVQYLFSLLFISIIREIPLDYQYELKTTPRIYKENSTIIIDNFFEQNYNYKATSQNLCKLIHISKSQLNRILKEKYNMTFKQKHIETQIEYIKYMLINTNMPIGTLAEKTGYTSDSNFTAFFKHVTGVSPKAFRNQSKDTKVGYAHNPIRPKTFKI